MVYLSSHCDLLSTFLFSRPSLFLLLYILGGFPSLINRLIVHFSLHSAEFLTEFSLRHLGNVY